MKKVLLVSLFGFSLALQASEQRPEPVRLQGEEFAKALAEAKKKVDNELLAAEFNGEECYVKYEYGIPRVVLYSSEEGKRDEPGRFRISAPSPELSDSDDDGVQAPQKPSDALTQKVADEQAQQPVLLTDSHVALYGRFPASYDSPEN